MKKTYDANLRLFITITNDLSKIEMVASIHTNIHRLKIQIAKKLEISVLDSHIDIYFRDYLPLKPTSTLLQNQIENNSSLRANVTRLKVIEKLQVQKEGSNLKRNNSSKMSNSINLGGLSIISSCTNSKCVNYNHDVEIQYGFGNFPIISLTSFAKCQLCPYKSQHLRPSMLSKTIKLNNCHYKIKGTQINNCGIPIQKDSGFFKTKHQKDIQQFIQKNPWHTNMMLIVKHI